MLQALAPLPREETLINIGEIQAFNFREAMKLAQRAVFLGLTVSALVQYLSMNQDVKELPSIPFIGVSFTTVESLQIALLVLYVGAGLVACFSAHRALDVLRSIPDENVAMELARFPSVIAAAWIYSLLLAGALIGSGILLGMNIFEGLSLSSFIGYSLIFAPFQLTLQMGGRIHKLQKR
tara:strand:+ start:2685 stop:3224 length:540 start_codon:yes stop_codon:yes gene_type:complete